jgi:hypothetical protein
MEQVHTRRSAMICPEERDERMRSEARERFGILQCVT